MEVPMLEEDESRQAMALRRTGTGDVRERKSGPVLREYERITGFRGTNINAVYRHVTSLFGPPCQTCGKPLREQDDIPQPLGGVSKRQARSRGRNLPERLLSASFHLPDRPRRRAYPISRWATPISARAVFTFVRSNSSARSTSESGHPSPRTTKPCKLR
jgi:hypothetical protein